MMLFQFIYCLLNSSYRKLLIQMEDLNVDEKPTRTFEDFQEIIYDKYNEASRRNFEDNQGRLLITGLGIFSFNCV